MSIVAKGQYKAVVCALTPNTFKGKDGTEYTKWATDYKIVGGPKVDGKECGEVGRVVSFEGIMSKGGIDRVFGAWVASGWKMDEATIEKRDPAGMPGTPFIMVDHEEYEHKVDGVTQLNPDGSKQMRHKAIVAFVNAEEGGSFRKEPTPEEAVRAVAGTKSMLEQFRARTAAKGTSNGAGGTDTTKNGSPDVDPDAIPFSKNDALAQIC